MAVILTLAMLSPVMAQEAALLYHLHPGITYALDIDLQQNTRSESLESEEISLYSKTSLLFRVDSTDSRGWIHMTVGYRDLQLSMFAPGMDMDINSGNGKNQMLSDMVDSLEVGAFQLVMDQRGNLISLDGLVPLFQNLSNYDDSDTSEHRVILSTLEEVYGPDAFTSLFGLFISIYPVMESMTSWTNDITYFFNTKPVPMVNRYSLTRITGDLWIIQGMGMLNASREFQEETSLGKVKSTVSGTQTYDFQIERESGWIRQCVSRQRTLIETTILSSSFLPPGLKIPSYTETLFEVKGYIIE